ncbi:class I glutamine amidotransferase-like protein, partial [Catenaria anguillulae PL171]
LIDNYDSYTFNVYQLLCALLPIPPIVIRNSSPFATYDSLLSSPSLLSQHIDAIVISPGPGSPDVPADFGICADVLKLAPSIPILGVCLGHQGLGHVHGARVVKAPEVMHGRTSPIEHSGTDLFGGIESPFNVVRYHSLIVHEGSLPPCLIPTAWNTDESTGRKLIMGMRHRDRPHFGVQFHPESICSQHGMHLMENF